MTRLSKIRIGAVSYLNTLPLVHGLNDRQSCVLSFDLPSRLASQLAANELDVALIPSVETFQNPQYTVVSNACIACRGPVWSVKLMSRKPIEQCRSLALDEGSRTSAALVQILLKLQHDITPSLHPLPIDQPWHDTVTDAVLIIGDRAMNPDSTGFLHEIDLGQWWYDLTGLPFVFAMWTARPGIDEDTLTKLDEVLSSSRDAGLAASGELATEHSAEYGLTVQQGVDYFQSYLHFSLGAEERKGLDRFRALAAEMAFAPHSMELQFHDR